MSDIRKVMNEEIRRLARKEIKAAVGPILAANSALKKRVAEQEKRIRLLESRSVSPDAAPKAGPVPSEQAEGKEKQVRLTPARIRKIRAKLAISQAQFAKILGVNTQSVNFWENGKTTPRTPLKKQMAAIRDMGKRELTKLFSEKEIVVKKAEKAVRSTIKAVREALRKEAAPAELPKKKRVRKAKAAKAAAPAQKKAEAPAPVKAPAAAADPAEKKA